VPVTFGLQKSRSALPLMWACLWVIHVYSYNFSSFANQIFYLYTAALALFGVVWLNSKRAFSALFRLVAVFLLHVSSFLVVSSWELIPGTTLRHLPFYFLNVLLLVASFPLGCRLDRENQLRVFESLAWAVVVWTAVQIFLWPELTRFGYGPLSMVLLPILVALRRPAPAAALFTMMLFSNHVTPLVAGSVAISVSVFLAYEIRSRRFFKNLATTVIGMVTLGLMLFPLMQPYLESTFKRIMAVNFGLIGTDVTRSYIVDRSWELLTASNGLGIGYMNFYAWSGIDSGYVYETDSGHTVEGFNLHNSFMTWGLEGGVLVILTLVFFFLFFLRRVRYIYSRDRQYGSAIYGVLAAFFVFALSHQLHMAPQFWAVIGLVSGYAHQLNYGHVEFPGSRPRHASSPESVAHDGGRAASDRQINIRG
jgi:hypothetical protein